ncbi:hypothetical protein LTR70_007228 [Exophiala xenobiotica]|uniref:Uncharacterized protein n=1 Tax=Lithohypha guttulata TaxID=1690604 RepID=A0ABR0K700_9EURO|nr:hypothetical protein LTR24_006044 [Lithohypha guttulata]KAK5314332.1 hypothetical protein LTR70_007228 [Exophiala xenobiotica]
MRSRTTGGGASALLLLATIANAHKGAHEHLEALHRRHRESCIAKKANESVEQNFELAKRGGHCAFPTDAGLVAVTPGSANAGWAMSPDQACEPGNYCPYACPPGQVSMQWDPKPTSYTYPQSMNGGLYCDSNGQISKPFPDKPYCASTTSNIGVVNNCGGPVAFCQTVLPGNEAMLIPTEVGSFASLAVPGTDYWASTAAHYYINPPGTDASTACVWGTSANPWGNWSPYVAGTNQDASGQTFIKLGWNPIYLEQATPFRNKMPDWGVKIDCPNGGCSGLPCAIDPSSNHVNSMQGGSSSGAGGGDFCVVTVSKGASANFVVYSGSNDGGSSSEHGSGHASGYNRGGRFYQSSAAASSASPTASSEAPSSSDSSTTTTTTISEQPTTTTTTTTSMTEESTWEEDITLHNSTMTHQSSTTTTWSSANTTTKRTGPTGHPSHSLFDTPSSSPSPTADAETGAAPIGLAQAASTGVNPIASVTGGAPTLSMSFLAIIPLALWSLI